MFFCGMWCWWRSCDLCLQVRAEIWSPGFRISWVDFCTLNPEYSKKDHKLAVFTETFYEVRFGPRCHTCGTSRWRHVVVFFSCSSFKSLKIYCWKMSTNTSPFVWAESLNNFPKELDPWPGIVTESAGNYFDGMKRLWEPQLSSDWLLLEGCWGAEPVADVPAVLTECWIYS